jgi:hypothetical protein
MKPVELVAVFVRFLAASLVFGGLSLVTQITEMAQKQFLYTGAFDRTLVLIDAAIVLAVFGAAVLSWLFPIRIARFVVPKEVESDLTIGLSAEQLEVCFLSLLGAYILVTTLPQTVWFVIQMSAVERTPEEPGQPGEPWATLAFCFVKLALGTFLLLRSTGIRRVVHTLRTAGTEPAHVD